MISRLSTYQLRTHYLFYKSLKLNFDGGNYNLGDNGDRTKLKIYMPFITYIAAMDFSEKEMTNLQNLIEHSIWGLNKENLIDQFKYGSPAYLAVKDNGKGIDQHGIVYGPTILGAELFMWTYGYGQKIVNELFTKNTIFEDNDIKIGSTKKLDQL